MVYTAITRAQKNLVVFDTPAGRFKSFFESQFRDNEAAVNLSHIKPASTLPTAVLANAMP